MNNNNWTLKIVGQNENGARIKIQKGKEFLSFREVFEFWQFQPNFIDFYVKSLISLDVKAFHWEHPAVKIDFLDKTYECMILKTNGFEKRSINETAFADYIHANSYSEVFYNLGKNAKLVVPTQKIYSEVYKHIGSFIRLAPKIQIHEQFQKLGKSVLDEVLEGKLIWLNTAGLGVIWLHMRLDTRPKYYKTMRYKNPDLLKR